MNVYFLIVMGIWLFLCSVQDVKRKEIHILLLVLGTLINVCISMLVIDISVYNRFGGLVLGVVLLGMNFITRGQIGIADGIIVCIIGWGLGFYVSSGILLFALFLSAIVSLILIVTKKVKRRTAIPFAPFLFAGFVGVLILT